MSERAMPKGVAHPGETVQLGLRVLALCGGNASRAANLLPEEHKVDKRTLIDLKNRLYAQRYLEILSEAQEEINAPAADQAMEIAAKANAVEEALVDETMERLKDIPARDLPRSAVALTQVKAENVRTSRLLRDRPTNITEIRNPAEIIAELQALGVLKKDGADDLIEAEVVGEQPVGD